MSLNHAHLITDSDANLNVFPRPDITHPANIKNQFTIGDIHGNALKLIYFLIRQNVLTMEENDYQNIVRIYQKDVDDLTADDLNEFNQILKKAKTNPVGAVRLIGDEVADRGSNDYFTLKIIKMLSKKGVPLEIMYSNHSADFIENYENQGNFNPPRLNHGHASSMFSMKKLLDRGLINKEKMFKLIDKHYKPHLKALSCTLNEDKTKITIYSHAAIGINTIKSLAKKLGVPYKDATAKILAQTINDINGEFEKHVKNNTVHTLYSDHQMMNGYHAEDIAQNKHPFEFLVWNRNYDHLTRPAEINFVHGHDMGEPSKGNIYNLDNLLGKSPDLHQGEYQILYSQDKAPQNLHIHPLFDQIKNMKQYGKKLKASDVEKGKVAIRLANALQKKAYNFFGTPEKPQQQTQATVESFQADFHKLLHSKDAVMHAHREAWKPIVANLAIAATVIGIVAIVGQLIYSKLATHRFSFFFAKTNREKQVDNIDAALTKLAPSAA